MSKQKYSSSDFKETSLPSTRKELFHDVSRHNFFSMLKMGLILFLFLIPILVIVIFRDFSYISSYTEGLSNRYIVIMFAAIEIPCLLLFAIPLSGLGKIFKEYAWSEPIFFGDDFKQGIKDNIKPTLIICFMFGVLNLIFEAVYANGTPGEISGWMVAIPFGFNLFVFFPILLHTLFISFVYTNPFWKNFKLGCFCYYKHIPSSLLCVILLYLYKVLDIFHFTNIITVFSKTIIFALIIILYIPFVIFGTTLNEMRIFDKHINSVRFPQLVNKGLYNATNNSKNER